VNHEQTFAFPPRPVISRRCMDLIASLICDREHRLSSNRYRAREGGVEHPPMPPGKTRMRSRSRDQKGRAVYPHDAEDIKAHKWFRDIPWEQLHLITPPFVPRITSVEDTHYFDEEEPISDWSESCSEEQDSSSGEEGNEEAAVAMAGIERNPLISNGAVGSTYLNIPAPAPNAASAHNVHPTTVIRRSSKKLAAMQEQLITFPPGTRAALAQFIASPYDSTRLKRMDREIEALALVAGEYDSNHRIPRTTSSTPSEVWQMCQDQDYAAAALVDKMKTFVRAFGRRERKRPRDRLLRDRKTKATVLEIRKQTAFLGYSFKRAAVATVPGIATFDGAEDEADTRVMSYCASLPIMGCGISDGAIMNMMDCGVMRVSQGVVGPIPDG